MERLGHRISLVGLMGMFDESSVRIFVGQFGNVGKPRIPQYLNKLT